MSDSVDRVFVHALATVRRLPRTGSSRPPPAARLQLYGLYKQSMEGDVEAILPRPTLPPASPDPRMIHTGNNSSSESSAANPNNSVHRYASRDLRTREAQAEIEKWDAWHACAGMSRTEAKRRYISTLIETMKEYASGTAESRELVGELEFVWNQIKSQSGSDPDDNGDNSPDGSRRRSNEDEESGGRSTSSRQKDPESPTRKLERAGLKNPVLDYSRSGSGDQLSARATGAGGSSLFSRRSNTFHSDANSNPQRKRRIRMDSSGLRILSPVSQRDSDSGSVVEGIDQGEDDDQDEAVDDEDDDGDDDDQNLNTAPTSPIVHSRSRPPPVPPENNRSLGLATWQTNIENSLRHLATEIAALREQMSANHLLSSSSFSHTYYSLSKRQRIWHRVKLYFWMIWKQAWRQAVVQTALLILALIWGRFNGDMRLETWVRKKLSTIRKRCSALLGKEGIFGWWIRRLLRIA